VAKHLSTKNIRGPNLDIQRHGVRNELADDLLQVGAGDLAVDDVEHLLADLTDLGRAGGKKY
jgi:hypothetical protein